MKKFYLLSVLFVLCWTQLSAFNYGGKAIKDNTEFTRAALTKSQSDIREISGMAMGRTNPSIFWVVLDDPYPTSSDTHSLFGLGVADGKVKYTIDTGNAKLRDWEDICMATVGGKNYILVGCIGDNYSEYKDKYYIYIFEEPDASAASSGKIPYTTITFKYPDGAHNAEALMYDPVDNLILVVDKWIGDEKGSNAAKPDMSKANIVFSMPFTTSTTSATLSAVKTLGNNGEFKNVTAADISADGQHILIKNETDILYWRRQSATESFATTIARDPEHISSNTYKSGTEPQGESVCWKADGLAFYTVSDEKAASQIYSYTRPNIPAIVIPLEVPANVNANATDNSISLTWNAVSGATAYQVKVCHTETTGGGTTSGGTPFTQVFNTYSGASATDIATSFTLGKVTVNAESGKPVQVSNGSGTVGNISYTKYLDLRGGGTTSNRSVQFTTDGAGTLTVYNNAAENGRSLVLLNGATTETSTNNTAVFNIPSAGTYYVYSLSGGIRIYAIDFSSTGGGSSSTICDDTYQTTGTSITIPNLQSGVAYTYQVKAIKGTTQQSEYCQAKTISTTGTTTSISESSVSEPVIYISQGQLQVKNAENQPVSIYNTLGQTIASNVSLPFDVNNLKGIYIIRIGNFSMKLKF